MKRHVIIVIIAVMIAATLGATVIPVQAKVNPAPVMRPRAALADNLVAYWKLDEASGTRNDSVGTNHLTSNNNVGQATGKHNYAANFVAASTQYLSIADNATLSTGDIDFTIASWVYFFSDNLFVSIVGKWNDPYEYYLGRYSDSRFIFSVHNGSSQGVLFSSETASINTWYYVVAWHDSVNNSLNLQINNSYVNTLSWSGGVQDGTSAFNIGRTSNFYADGLIDSVGFWKRTLTSTERTLLYASGAGCDYPFTACEATATPTASNTPTSTATSTFTPTSTATFTPSNTSTPTDTPTATFTPTHTATATATHTATHTATSTSTSTSTATFTLTPSHTPTATPDNLEILPIPTELGGGTVHVERRFTYDGITVFFGVIALLAIFGLRWMWDFMRYLIHQLRRYV